MIAVDTSALMAIVLGEPGSDACIAVLEGDDDLVISAGSVAEALIVAGRRNVRDEMERLLDGLGFEIVSVTPDAARRIAQACADWGKGVHPAALNIGDCFAYDTAKQHACPLLYIGNDFARTDIQRAI
jgi:ribonuclease VapC